MPGGGRFLDLRCHRLLRGLIVRPGISPGFSLLEVTVALVAGGLAVAAAAALLMTVSARADMIESAARAVDADVNGERLLRSLTRSVDASVDSVALKGSSKEMTVRTWCETSLGWTEPCRVRLAFRTAGTAQQLTAERLDGQGEILLRSGARSGRFIYLIDVVNGGSWVESWTRITVPPAVGVVLDGDTLVLPL